MTVANMNDYLRWRGDLSLEERPLNEADALVLSCLSYIDLGGIVPTDAQGGIMALGEALDRLLKRVGDDVSSCVRSLATLDATYLRSMGQSRRFGGLALHDYVDVMDDARSLQFAALQIDLPCGDTFVSFRGTDSSLVGWREDFMLSFTVTQAQLLASSYCQAALSKALGRGSRVYLGGHSKGGNLVAYAVASCPAPLREPIAQAYSFDGPGMTPEVVPQGAYDVVGERFRHICPTYSVIGMLLNHPQEPCEFVESSSSGVLQHDPMTWQFEPYGLVRAAGLSEDARPVDEAIAQWVDGIDLERRAEFVGELFDVLAAGGARDFGEVLDPLGVQRVLRAAASASPASRELVGRLVAQTVGAYRSSAKERVTQAMSAAVQRVSQTRDEISQQALGLAGGSLAVEPRDSSHDHGND